MPLSPALAYGCRYARPLKHLFTSTLSHTHRRSRSLFAQSALKSNLSLSLLFPHSSFLTGNSLLSTMQGQFYQIVWTYAFVLVTFSGAYCTLSNGNACPITLDEYTRPLVLSHAEVEQLGKQFWSGSGISKNKAMVENLQHHGIISSKKVAEVMEAIDRALFVPDGTPPYVDSPMSIGYNATISAPHMHAMCLQLLEQNLQPGMHALDVGSGTGYLTACFALMVGPQGRAVGVEHIPELVSSSIENIQKSAAAPLLKDGSLSVHAGDGRKGWPEHGPYDAIHVGAAAAEIPQPLIDQLKPGGRLVIPVGNVFQDLKVIDKKPDGSISVRSETSVRYVPLTSREAQLRGY